MAKNKLTIVIPTYNRNNILYEGLINLLPQLNDCKDCTLLIMDNCSEIPVKETLGILFKKYADVKYSIHRNKFNVGASANMLRGLELCESEWIWFLGDDDLVLKNGLNIVLDKIDKNHDCCFINFFSNVDRFTRSQSFITHGSDEFITKMDSFSNVLFISAGIYKVEVLQKHIRIGYQYIYSLGFHIGMLLFHLKDNDSNILFSSEQVVHWQKEESGNSLFNVALSLPILLELPMNSITRKLLAGKILALFNYSLNRRQLFFETLFSALRSKDYIGWKHSYFHYRARMHYFDSSLKNKVETYIYLLLMQFPKCTYGILSLLYLIIKKKKFGMEFNEKFERL